MYSQNNEEEIILGYFGPEYKGRLLDIGANDGKTLSNSLRLIELGWSALLIEPANRAFAKLFKLHEGNDKVVCEKVAVGKSGGVLVLHESGALLGNHDTSLVSTLIPEEKERWNRINMSWDEGEVEVVDYKTLTELHGDDFDFITIDAEGLDYEILSQIDLSKVKLVCVEHNGIQTEKYKWYCEKFGMREIARNQENIIMAK
jgi:FkbM family methyltransferase